MRAFSTLLVAATALALIAPSAAVQRSPKPQSPVVGVAQAAEKSGDNLIIDEARIKICGIDGTQNDASHASSTMASTANALSTVTISVA